MLKNVTAPRIGIYEKAMPDNMDWRHKLQTAKALGFHFVEMSIDESEERRSRLNWDNEAIYDLRRQCECLGMPIQSICLSAHRKFPFGSECEETRQEAFVIMQKAISLAYKLGARCIQLAGYDVYYEPHTDASHRRFIDGLTQSVKWAENAGVMLAVEIMDTTYLNSLSKFEVLKRAIPSPYFMAYPDVGNINGWNYDTPTELELSAPHLVQVHLKDTKKVSETSKGQFRDLVIGEGDVDFVSVFRTLAKIQYSGPLVIEMWAKDESWIQGIGLAQKRLSDASIAGGYGTLWSK
ncbi:L-ribulose-5-phosphate 3-epimerase [Vibrio sp. S9_S30]|uniref:L-ribulose-5-phosphate 3-epimerase n=1 Tax=Vibrio sp. S9_S30 TaxID=2720226 RepID=UPI00167FEC73|nr:L-ribulose-5-phosphate 3-epimerase [Vibrio sp. S9_S30]MBD1558822.1 L-ribulose-5-phosphate 3-epimerase [Vibrio sp. S9_S30]